MKIVILSIWYSENMGYIENALPKAMASLGHEVHVVASTAQVYYNEPNYEIIYKPYLGDRILKKSIKEIDGFKLHRLPFYEFKNKIIIKGLKKKLLEIKPDVVQAFDAFSFLTLQAAFYKPIIGYKLFTANHIVASVFPLFTKDSVDFLDKISFFLTRTLPGRISSWFTSLCYPATIDALDIAIKYYGIPRKKVKQAFLGVDTDLFFPMEMNKEIIDRRLNLGVKPDEILCIYTGRFTEGKNPLCLALAIDKLVRLKEPFKALFLGDGPQIEQIKELKGCIVHDFVPYNQLPEFYKLADIGIWPQQESTSMLDATASGLPIIISNKVKAVERVEGNGLTYIEGSFEDLASKLIILKDKELRNKMSEYGVKKISNKFSWLKIAEERIEDYKSFL